MATTFKITAIGCDTSGSKNTDDQMRSASIDALYNAVNQAVDNPSVTQGESVGSFHSGHPVDKSGIFAHTQKYLLRSTFKGNVLSCKSLGLKIQFEFDADALRQVLVDAGALEGVTPKCPEGEEWDGEQCVPIPVEEEEPPAAEVPDEDADTDDYGTDDSYDTDMNKTSVMPQVPESPTHRVKTKGSRLALRFDPAEVAVAEGASADRDKKGGLILMIRNGTKIIVLDEGQGHDCEWSQVHIPGGNIGWMYNKFIEKLSDQPESLEIKCTNENITWGAAEDWTTKEINKPYEDKAMLQWRVSYETEWESTGGDQLENRMMESRYGGLKLILDHLAKDSTEEQMEKILSAFVGVRSYDYYVDPRPNSMMRVLVVIDKKYIEALPDALPDIVSDGIDMDSGGDVSTQTYETVPYNVRECVYHSMTLRGDTWEEKLVKCGDYMRGHASLADKFDGTIETLDLRKEAQRLEGLRSKILNLCSTNGATFGQDDSLEIGADENLVPCYAALQTEGGEYKYFKKGIEAFKDGEGTDSERTMNYFFRLYDMSASSSSPQAMTWTDFVSYNTRPVVVIKPSGNKDEQPADISDASVDKNSSTSGNTTADKVDEEISGPEAASRTTGEDGAGGGEQCLPILEGNLPDIKIKAFVGFEGKKQEDLMLKGEELLSKVWEEAKSSKDYVGDTVTSDIQALQDKITTLDDVFAEVLNKVSLGDLMAAAAKCIKVGNFNFDLDFPELRLPCLELPAIPTIGLPDSLPTDDIMADLSVAISDMIMDLLTQLFVEMVKGILDQLLDICDSSDEDGDFGAEGLNDKLDDAVPRGPLSHKATEDLKLGIMKAAGLFPTVPQHPTDRKDAIDCITALLDDVATLLTPIELCKLLKGEASNQAIALIRSLIKRKHPCVADRLKTKTAIINLFILIGNVVNSQFCDDLSRRGPPMLPPGSKLPCDDDGSVGSLRDDLLRGKGDNLITDDQIAELLDRARKRKKDQAKKLLDNMNKFKDLQDGKGNPFQLPPLFCGEGPRGEPLPGLMQLEHPSADFMLEKVLQTMYEPVYMAFNRDAKDFAPTLIQSTTEKVAIPIFLSGDGIDLSDEMYHPEILKMEGQGVDRKMVEQAAIPNLYNGEQDGIWVDVASRKVSPTLRNLLQQMETNGSFNTKLDHEGIYFELVLPQEQTVLDGVAELQKQFDKLKEIPDFEDNFGEIPDLAVLADVVPEWRVRYKVPWQHLDKDKGQQVDDEYIVHIFPNADYDADEGLRTLVEEEIPEAVKSYIQSPWGQGGGGVIGDADGGLGMTVEVLTEDDLEENLEEENEAARDTTKYALRFDESVDLGEWADLGYIIFNVYPVSKDPCNSDDDIEGEAIGTVNFPWDLWNLLGDANSVDDIVDIISRMGSEEKCTAIRLVMSGLIGNIFPTIVEKLNELFEDCELTYDEIKNSERYMAPPPHAVFGKHVSNIWTDAIASTGFDFATDLEALPQLETFQTKLSDYFTHYVHPQISKDLLALVSKQVADSILFGRKEFMMPSGGGSGAAAITSRQPYLELLKLSINPKASELACGINPHLLNIQQAKEAAKKKHKDSGGLCGNLNKVKTDGSKREDQDSLEDSVLDTLVVITIRAYMIDYFLRGIFPFTEFKLEETMDGYLVEFIVENILSELASFKTGYVESFSERATHVYQGLVEAGEIDWAPINKLQNEELSEEGADASVDEEEHMKVGLRELCRYQMISVSKDIGKIIKRDLPGISPQHKNIHDWFLEDWLALIDIAKYEDEDESGVETWSTRFTQPESTFSSLLEYNTGDAPSDAAAIAAKDYDYKTWTTLMSDIQSGDRPSNKQKLTLKTEFGNGKPFDLENGNLFLEKYMRVVRRSSEDMLAMLSYPREGEDEEGNTITIPAKIGYGSKATEIINGFKATLLGQENGPFDNSTSSSDDYIAVDQFDDWFKAFRQWYIDEVAEFAVADVEEIERHITLNDFFEEISFGLRLMHTTPITNNQFVYDTADSNFVSSTETDMSAYYFAGVDQFGEKKVDQNAIWDWSELGKFNPSMVKLREKKKACCSCTAGTNQPHGYAHGTCCRRFEDD